LKCNLKRNVHFVKNRIVLFVTLDCQPKFVCNVLR